MWIAIVTGGIVALAWALVGSMRHYSLSRGVLDTPSARSSHRQPTPRGAGAGLLTAGMTGFLVLSLPPGLRWEVGLALVAVIAVAVVGWADDKSSVAAELRAAVHVGAGFLLAPLAAGGATGLPAVLLVAGCVVATVAAINVVNFMDGIDGIIGLQAVVFGVHLVAFAGEVSIARNVGLALAAGSLGFLLWNWPPARIFLGDVGSGGLAVFALAGGLAAWREGGWAFIAIFLPLFAIFLDAAVTLGRRAARGEPLATPHRTHLYQRLANDAGWGHARVTLLYGCVAVIGSLVAAFAPYGGRMWAWLGYAASVTLLGWLLDRVARAPAPASKQPSLR